MSAEDQGGAGRREVAYRLFAAEFEDADFSYSESDEERAPNYVVTPTGARVNRLFVVGVLTEVENASKDVLRARVVDPTGAFVVYAGQYQPDAQAFFDRAEPPMFVAVTGKARTFQPDDSDVTYTSVRPENVNEVDAGTRDRWTVGTVRQTLHRVATMAGAIGMDERGDELAAALEARGIDDGLAAGIPLAIEHYGTTPAYLDAVRDTAVSAAEVVAGERDEVAPLRTDPGSPGDADLASLAALDVPASVGGGDGSGALTAEPSPGTTGDASTAGESGSPATETTSESATAEPATATTGSGSSSPTESSADAASTATDAGTGTDADAGGETESTTGAATSAGAQSSTDTGQSTDADSGQSTDADSGQSTDADTRQATDTDSEAEPAAESDQAASSGGSDADEADDLGDFDPGEFELDEEEREEIEQEYGTEFKSGTEVDEPGEADIETPEPEPESESGTEPASESEAEPTSESEAESGATAETDTEPEPAAESEQEADDASEPSGDGHEPGAEPESETDESASDDAEPAEDVDLDEAVMDAMAAEDTGDGASEADIVDAVTARTEADADAVRDAIQDALMQGQCYEPEDGVYKPI